MPIIYALRPLAVHFWAPTFKWGISIANIADLNRPADKISMPQQLGWSLGAALGGFLAKLLQHAA